MTAVASEIDIDRLRAWIGREEIADTLVSQDIAHKYHATLDIPGDPPGDGDIVPRLMHWCLAQHIVPEKDLDHDGHPRRGGFLPPIPLPRRMWAGGALEFSGDLRVGDRMRRISRIADVTLKQGRTGSLCFVSVAHEIETGGRIVVRERQDIVYRDIQVAPEIKQDVSPAPQGTHRRAVHPTTILLFRYSALTFNAHRIHFDREHTIKVEGYPGLVVHGPMQAALLFNFATELRGLPPSSYNYRSLSPLFDIADFALAAEGGPDAMQLWTCYDGGPLAMTSQARWS